MFVHYSCVLSWVLKQHMSTWVLTLNTPIATKVVCFVVRQLTDRQLTESQLANKNWQTKKIFTDTTTERQRQVADTTTHRQKPIIFLYKTDYHSQLRLHLSLKLMYMYNGFFLYILPGHFGFRFIRMVTGFSFIRSQRGKNKLVSEGYIYKVDRVRDEKSYWVCHLPDCKCRCIQTADEFSYTHKLSNHRD